MERSDIYKLSKDVFNEIPENTDFYFVHSYVFLPDNPDHIMQKQNIIYL